MHCLEVKWTAQRSNHYYFKFYNNRNELPRGNMHCSKAVCTAQRPYALLKGRMHCSKASMHCSKAVCTAQRLYALLKTICTAQRPYALLKGRVHCSKAHVHCSKAVCTAQRLCARCSAVIIFIPRPLCFAEWETKACYCLYMRRILNNDM